MANVTILFREDPFDLVDIDNLSVSDAINQHEKLYYDSDSECWVMKISENKSKWFPRSSVYKIVELTTIDKYEGDRNAEINQLLMHESPDSGPELIGSEELPLLSPLQYHRDIQHWHCIFQNLRIKENSQHIVAEFLIPQEQILWVEK